MAKKNPASVKAKHGEKMIEVKIRLWTNDISNDAGCVIPKHAWTSGVVHMEKNDSHGITPCNPKVFHSLLDIGAVIEKVLMEHDIVLHPSTKMQKYITQE